jgi:hypothetical protein
LAVKPNSHGRFPLEDAKTPAKQGFGASEKFGRSVESRPNLATRMTSLHVGDRREPMKKAIAAGMGKW